MLKRIRTAVLGFTKLILLGCLFARYFSILSAVAALAASLLVAMENLLGSSTYTSVYCFDGYKLFAN